MTKSIKLLLADDHMLVREGLKQLFSLTRDIEVVAEATNSMQVLDALRLKRVALVLLDLSMPGIGGPDLIARISAQQAPPSILVLSMHNEPQIVRRALAAGARGYLTKDNNPDILLAGIRKVAGGGRFLDPLLAEKMAFESTLPLSQRLPHETLSEREFQVFVLLAKGLSVNEIADQMAVSNKTVSTHKARLMRKMSFANHTDVVKYAIVHGITDWPQGAC